MIHPDLKFTEMLAANDWIGYKSYSQENFLKAMELSRIYARFAIKSGIADKFIEKDEPKIDRIVLDAKGVGANTQYRVYSTERGGMLGLKTFLNLEDALDYLIHWRCNNYSVALWTPPVQDADEIDS